MKTYAAVVGIIKFDDKILLLKRNGDRTTSPNMWQGVSGALKEREAAEDAVLREVKEETGLDGRIVRAGDIIDVSDEFGRWIVIPFLVSVDSDDVKIDENEHTEFRWISPAYVDDFDCVVGTRKELVVFGLLTDKRS
ncbi:MAG: NUDIX domain-containing protein [Candidatus Aenigmarchaeota archaeon]|nr:NUDIX domain-containing protein [Candidatus Aenigmarchaeota archaeon]